MLVFVAYPFGSPSVSAFAYLWTFALIYALAGVAAAVLVTAVERVLVRSDRGRWIAVAGVMAMLLAAYGFPSWLAVFEDKPWRLKAMLGLGALLGTSVAGGLLVSWLRSRLASPRGHWALAAWGGLILRPDSPLRWWRTNRSVVDPSEPPRRRRLHRPGRTRSTSRRRSSC